MGDAPYLRDERVVAKSSGGPPEYESRAVLRREFHADSPAVRLLVEDPLGGRTEFWDSHHVEVVIDLLRRALPVLRHAEHVVENEWRAWLERVAVVGLAEVPRATDDREAEEG